MSGTAPSNLPRDTMPTRSAASSRPPGGPRPERIEAAHVVADVLSWHPRTLSVFERFGFTLLRHAVVRRTLARTVTVAQAARLGGVSRDALLRALNEAVPGRSQCAGSADGSQALRYDTPVNELIAQLPGTEKMLADAGLNLEDGWQLPLGEAADRAGVPRETVIAMLASLTAAHDSPCRADCASCAGHVEGAHQACHRTPRPRAWIHRRPDWR